MKHLNNGEPATPNKFYRQQRRECFTVILKQLKQNCNKPLNTDGYHTFIKLLTFFAKRFEYEKQFMLQNNSENNTIHNEQHALFINHLSWSFETAVKQKMIPCDLCDFISEWLNFHTEIFDKDLLEAKTSPPMKIHTNQ